MLLIKNSPMKCAVTIASTLILQMAVGAPPQSGNGYALFWTTSDAGGGVSAGQRYTVAGTVGQWAVGSASDGSRYALAGGFWAGEPFCKVEFEDFARFAEYWLDESLPGDAQADNVIGFGKLQELANLWLDWCPTNWPFK